VLAAAQEWAAGIAGRTSPAAVAATRAMLRAAPADARTASATESRTIAALIREPDCAEGVAAFLERRPPRFAARGRPS
jgi:enoyl-CoA hydratase/carnithine racemase